MTRKKYTIVVEDDEVVSIEINGQRYGSWIEIPDNVDQQKVEKMVDAATGFFQDEDFETRTSSSLEKIIVPVFGVVALILLVVAVITGINSGKLMAREQEAPGQVMSLVAQRDSEGDLIYYPVVAFTLPDRKINTVQLSVGSSPPSYETGQQVTVLYDPTNPDQVRIKSFVGMLGLWLVTLITGGMGIIFAGVTGITWWMVKPEKKKEAIKARFRGQVA